MIICPRHGLSLFFENDIFISWILVIRGKTVQLLTIHVNDYPLNSLIRSYNCNGHAWTDLRSYRLVWKEY